MVQSRKKQPFPGIAAFLVLTVLGTFVFSIAEIPHDFEMAGSKPFSTGIFTSVSHTVDWLAEETNTVNSTRKISSSSLRNGLPRILMPVETYNAAKYLMTSPIHITNVNNFSSIKETIPLKLRI